MSTSKAIGLMAIVMVASVLIGARVSVIAVINVHLMQRFLQFVA